MRLLCVDVRNDVTRLGVYDGEQLTGRFRIATDVRRTGDEWSLAVSGLLQRLVPPSEAEAVALDGICVCSAVPAVLPAVREMAASTFRGSRVVVLGPGVRTGLSVLVDNPREVGTDRIANAVAARDLVGGPAVVVDLGTAITFDVLDGTGAYVGGAIAPGVAMSLAALGERGAQLRQVELRAPRGTVARNTIEALQSGAVYGFAGLVEGLVERIRAELDVASEHLQVVVTGEVDNPVVEACRCFTRREPDLTLHGLRLVYLHNP